MDVITGYELELSKKLRGNEVGILHEYTGTGRKTEKYIRVQTLTDRKEDPVTCMEFSGYVEPCPNSSMYKNSQREVLYVAGSSGSGKSYYIAQYARNYLKLFPKHVVVVFSEVEEDPAFKDIDIIQFKLDDVFVQNQTEKNEHSIGIGDLKDSLCIFDDTDTISNKKARTMIAELKDQILQTGRHHNISMCCTSHVIQNYLKTRTLILEATHVVLFPKSGAQAQIRNFLKAYMGMNKKEIDKAMSLDGRWICCHKAAPNFIMYQKGIYM